MFRPGRIAALAAILLVAAIAAIALVDDDPGAGDGSAGRATLGDAATGDDCRRPDGSLAGGEPPGGCWRPYADDSPFNRPLPDDPRLDPRSDRIVDKLAGWGPPLALRPGIAESDGASDYDHPVYFARPDDPLFTVEPIDDAGDSDYWGEQIRIPQQALPATGSDAHMTVVDQESGIEWGLQKVARNPDGRSLERLPDGGGTIYANGFGMSELDGSGLNVGTGDANAARWGLLGGIVRPGELLAARTGRDSADAIPHALFMVVNSTDGSYVYPASGQAAAGDPVDAPADGARFQLAMSDSEIEALDVAWYDEALLKTMARYGMFVGDTSGSGSWTVQLESGRSFTSFGHDDPWSAFGRRERLPFDAGQDHYLWDFDVVDWRSRLRVVDPCVSRGSCDR